MSLPKRDRKIQPTSGKNFPIRRKVDELNVAERALQSTRFPVVIADALRREFGETHAAIKTVVKLTNANERAVKNWFTAKNGPTGKHLVDLVRTSDEVLEAVLLMSDRRDLVIAKKLRDTKRTLTKMLTLLGDLEVSR